MTDQSSANTNTAAVDAGFWKECAEARKATNDQLREEVRRLQSQLDQTNELYMTATHERARLREALEKIADGSCIVDPNVDWERIWGDCVDCAREALKVQAP